MKGLAELLRYLDRVKNGEADGLNREALEILNRQLVKATIHTLDLLTQKPKHTPNGNGKDGRS